jgi:hypothetical protein
LTSYETNHDTLIPTDIPIRNEVDENVEDCCCNADDDSFNDFLSFGKKTVYATVAAVINAGRAAISVYWCVIIYIVGTKVIMI